MERLQAGAYDAVKDFVPLQATGDWVSLTAGTFMILWPHDAHAPGIAWQAPCPVRKAVLKIRV